MATYVGATRPDLVRGLVLLNATPFWSNAPNPKTDPAGAARMPWNGVLPAPWFFTALVGLWWNTLRKPATVRTLLGLVYTDASALDDKLVESILAPTRRPQAKEVFVSIFLSPRAPLSFNDMLDALQCPVCMIYGRDDPWVVPIWGQRAMRRLPASTAYYELFPAGHCPHHERPQAVNMLLAGWLASRVDSAAEPLVRSVGKRCLCVCTALSEPHCACLCHRVGQPAPGDALELALPGGGVLRAERTDGSPRNAFEIADAEASARSADGRTKSAPGVVAAVRRLLPQKEQKQQ